ncbi:MAG: cyclic nucleotide-binding domain-containing protein [Proteobacteria bacterium]|jgi:CRP/FNR family transcriptional regulator|nr:cyclic nucleotide-binding domain-containing protein [Pseudomonadota bacterium]
MELQESITAFVRNRLTFKQGQSIFEEGSQARYIFIIMQGKVRIRKHTPKGMVTLAVLEKGQVLGETSFFDKAAKLRAADAVAETDVVLGVLSREKLEQELSLISPIQQEILAGLARRIRITTATAALLAGG